MLLDLIFYYFPRFFVSTRRQNETRIFTDLTLKKFSSLLLSGF